MPVNINGELYSIKKIEELIKEKLEIAKKVEELLKQLIEEHVNDEKIEEKLLQGAENIENLIKKGDGEIRVNEHMNGELKFMRRDMQELKRELALTKEIHDFLNRLVEIAYIEKRYFDHYSKQ